MSKHTQGEWDFWSSPIRSGGVTGPAAAAAMVAISEIENAGYGFHDEVFSSTKETVAIALGDTQEKATCNARLIAAAPDLLEALKVMTAHYCNLVRSGDAGNWEPDAEQEVMTAKAAIAKATGND